ncbi:HNH endonuclease [Microcystis aeruginosa LEGE 11464]|jgi:hypothetical protein|uniref:HNH endonuclease n=3 Tax=Microcystis aeruginosa TaxID=1126 RepID=A0A5J4F660_MICAE|nr:MULTISPECIES: HNH endonuclease [Microcystis]MCZ8126486.1 HNH endonuclease [Microcystis sp. LE19-114.1B]MBE9091421.1 HNH endonuclease [Microcystis aeruginosa LEGE 11464]MBE9246731.1 HNH endonuclease [Microcystis aeruginosa LEGE 00239]MCA2657100.1 HNH endonuclease [Microcystis sp. M049S2]GCA79798.1 hypothetical protein MiTs_01795 [Microcystis aeruginosa NIES-2521]
MVIPKSLYHIVRQRARFRCEYCHYPELLSSAPLSIDHIQPFIQNARRQWIAGQLHPPKDDPQQEISET